MMGGMLDPYLPSTGPLTVPQRRAGIMQSDIAGPMAKMFMATGRTRGLPDTGFVPGGVPFLSPVEIAEIMSASGAPELSMPHQTDNMPTRMPRRLPPARVINDQEPRDPSTMRQGVSMPRRAEPPRPEQHKTAQKIPSIRPERLQVAENVGSLMTSRDQKPPTRRRH